MVALTCKVVTVLFELSVRVPYQVRFSVCQIYDTSVANLLHLGQHLGINLRKLRH